VSFGVEVKIHPIPSRRDKTMEELFACHWSFESEQRIEAMHYARQHGVALGKWSADDASDDEEEEEVDQGYYSCEHGVIFVLAAAGVPATASSTTTTIGNSVPTVTWSHHHKDDGCS